MISEYEAFVESRPPHVREVMRRFDPWTLYRYGRQRVIFLGLDEEDDGGITARIHVSAQYNLVLFERNVFGVPWQELEECDLPDPHEITGAIAETDEEINTLLKAIPKPEKKN